MNSEYSTGFSGYGNWVATNLNNQLSVFVAEGEKNIILNKEITRLNTIVILFIFKSKISDQRNKLDFKKTNENDQEWIKKRMIE